LTRSAATTGLVVGASAAVVVGAAAAIAAAVVLMIAVFAVVIVNASHRCWPSARWSYPATLRWSSSAPGLRLRPIRRVKDFGGEPGDVDPAVVAQPEVDPARRIQLRSTDVIVRSMSWGLAAFAATLAVGGVMASSLRLDGHGLAASLPPAYFLALVCLPLASGLQWLRGGQASTTAIVVHVVLFVLIVWLTPLVLEGTPRFRSSYVNFGYVDPVLRGVGLLPDHFIYHNWPLFPVAMAALVGATGISPLLLMAVFPIIMMLAFLVPLATILRTIAIHVTGSGEDTGRVATHAHVAWPAGLWLFAVFDWTSQDYFSPQAAAYLLFITWLAVLVHVVIRRRGELTPVTTIALLGLFSLMVLTHVLTSLEVLGVLVALTAARLLRRPTLVVTCALIFIVWQLNMAGPFFAFYADRLHETLLDIGDFVQVNLASRISGSQQHGQIVRLRILVTGTLFALAGLAVLVRLLGSGRSRGVMFGIAFLFGIAFVAPASVYGGEMLIRVLLFSLPILAGLAVTAFGTRAYRLLLVAVITVMAPIHILTHYGNELHDYVSPGEIAGFEFVSSSLPPANVFGGYPGGNFEQTALLDARNSYLSRGVLPSGLEDFLDPTLHHAWDHKDWPTYILLSRGDDAAMELFQDRPGFISDVKSVLDRDPTFRVVHANPDITIYQWQRRTTATEPSAGKGGTGAGASVPSGGIWWVGPVSLAVVVAMILLELGKSLKPNRPFRRLADRATWPLVVISLAVILASGFRLAEIIGFVG
jgi:hypothetical protein